MARFIIKVDKLTVCDELDNATDVVFDGEEVTVKDASTDDIRALADLFATIDGDTNNELVILDADRDTLHYIDLLL